MPQIDLDTLFPAVPEGTPSKRGHTYKDVDNPVTRGELIEHQSNLRPQEHIKTRWAAIYTLELRGFGSGEIAEALGISASYIGRITSDERYVKYREERLHLLDSEFVAMKPLAFTALKNGLRSVDESVALRASEQWFKGAGFGNFAKEPPAQNTLTAEEVARQLLNGVQVNVQVNVNEDEKAA